MASKPTLNGGSASQDRGSDERPVVSVVIATYNRPELLRRLLTQLATQKLGPRSFEVLVVDDGSDPPAEPALGALELPLELRCLTQVNAGASAARHAGVLQARAEILVLLDDDMEIPEGFLSA